MKPVVSIDEALSAIAELLRSNQVQSAQPEDLKTVALRKVWHAVDKTRAYLTVVGKKPNSKRKPNEELAALWSEAALAIAVLDRDLAYRLRLKAEYWSAPSSWNMPDVRIGVDEVAAEARSLLILESESAAQGLPEPAATEDPERHDVFISHASEDKRAIAAPLARELKERGYKVWYDDFKLRLGDDLRFEIDKGLSVCRYGAVILSPKFFSKDWPRQELNGLIALEVSERRQRILPIWHRVEQKDVVRFSPMLAGRLGVPTSRGLEHVVEEVVKVLESTARPRAKRRTRAH